MHSTLLRCLSSLAAVLVAMLLSQRLPTQCDATWQARYGVPGTNGAVAATVMWDPDGSGPATSVIVVGGTFTVAGPVLANRIATYDPVTRVWGNLGTGIDGFVFALAVLPSGDLVAAGQFFQAGGVAVGCIARWNGTNWLPLGAGVDAAIDALLVAPNGDLYASGAFRNAGGAPANRIAKWNGTNWSTLGAGLGVQAIGSTDRVSCLAMLPNGDLLAAGRFSQSGFSPGPFVSVQNIARWNGTNWSSFGFGLTNGINGLPLCLLALPDGTFLIGGAIISAGGVPVRNIAKWNGTGWSALDTGLDLGVSHLVRLPNGRILAAGGFTNGNGVSILGIVEWDGVRWSQFGGLADTGIGRLQVLPGGDIVAAGQFTSIGALPVMGLARWDGVSWSRLGIGFDGIVEDMAVLPNGDLIVGGQFQSAGPILANRIARRSGGVWSPLGAGMDGTVLCVHALPNGDVVAGGEFLRAGGLAANRIARWNGTSWVALGPGLDGKVRCIASMPNGDLVVGGDFASAGGVAVNHVARWDGTSWSALGSGSGTGVNGFVTSLLVRSSGELVVAGGFTLAGGVQAYCIASWNGASWTSAFGGIPGPGYAMLEMPNGDFVVGGFIQGLQWYLARWNGVGWVGFGAPGVNNPVHDLALLPNRDLVVVGEFNAADGSPAMRVARWDGSAWHAMDTGTDFEVRALEVMPDGTIAIGGAFQAAGGRPSVYFSEMTQPCPATASVAGSGCPGSNGPVGLEVISLPWIGSSFGARAAGFPQLSVGFWMLGTTTVSLPATAAHPAALPGCQLFTMGDLGTGFLSPSAGAAVVRVEVPRDPILVGLAARMQVASIELDAQSNITAIASSNAIDFTLGRF